MRLISYIDINICSELDWLTHILLKRNFVLKGNTLRSPSFFKLIIMRLTQEQKEEIKGEFTACKTVEELVSLLNKINGWRHKDPHWQFPQKEITIKNLKYFLYSKTLVKYHTFEIPKKSGGTRKITQPKPFLKLVQRLLNECFHACFTPMPTATGFVPGRSIVDNAKKHTGRKYVYNIDLKDFFPSINFFRVRAMLAQVPPFKIDQSIATIIANLCCYNNSLPQGAPTSPVISNFVCKRLDAKFYKLSKKENFTFSRYADDITISSDKNIFSEDFKNKIKEIIEDEGFHLNEKKERLQRNNVKSKGEVIRERQEVTGIVVNKKTNVSRHFIRNLRATLHNWKKNGYTSASAQHQLYYYREKGFLRYNGSIPSLEQVVGGKIEYLGMVRGKDDLTYIDLKIRFDSLCMKESYSEIEFEEIIKIGETQGLKAAMDKFYNRKNLSANGK